MKKILLSLFLSFVVFVLVNPTGTLAKSEYPTYAGYISVNGETIDFPKNEKPIVNTKTNRILVPVRFVAEAMGAKVEWNAQKQQVIIRNEHPKRTVIYTIGSNEVSVDGKKKKIDQPALLLNGRTMIPIRSAVEYLDGKVTTSSSGYFTDIETSLYRDSIPGTLYTSSLKYDGKVHDITLFVPKSYVDAGRVSYELVNLKYFSKEMGIKLKEEKVFIPKTEAIYKNLKNHVEKMIKNDDIGNGLLTIANLNDAISPLTAFTVLATSTEPITLNKAPLINGANPQNVPATQVGWALKQSAYYRKNPTLILDDWYKNYKILVGLRSGINVAKMGFSLNNKAFDYIKITK